MKISYDINSLVLIFSFASFMVNIIVQLTKNHIPLPTKLWCIIVAVFVDSGILWAGAELGYFKWSITAVVFGILSSFMVAFTSMYGFDTMKELWQRFKAGENINGDN